MQDTPQLANNIAGSLEPHLEGWDLQVQKERRVLNWDASLHDWVTDLGDASNVLPGVWLVHRECRVLVKRAALGSYSGLLHSRFANLEKLHGVLCHTALAGKA